VRGEARASVAVGALGIVETATVAATILAADAAAKAAAVRLIEMQLARGIGGKAYFIVTGALDEVEAAVEAGVGVLDAAMVRATEIIAAPHEDLVARLPMRGNFGRPTTTTIGWRPEALEQARSTSSVRSITSRSSRLGGRFGSGPVSQKPTEPVDGAS